MEVQASVDPYGSWSVGDSRWSEVAPIIVVSGTDAKPQTLIDWKKRDNQALAQIALTVSNNELVHLRNAKSSHEAWNKICSVYEAKGLAAKVYLRRRFFNVKYVDNGVGSMQTHINLVRDLADQLDAISASVTDEDMAMTLLCSLPESYDYLIVALESRVDELSFDFVSTRLLSEEKRKEEAHNVSINANMVGHANNKGNENVALYSNAHGNGNKPKSSKSVLKCPYCNKKGHTEEKCYTKHGYPVGHPKHNSTANIASVSVNNATLHAFMVSNKVGKVTNNVTKVTTSVIG